MLTCLQLSSLSLSVYYILLLDDEGRSFSDKYLKTRMSIEWILENVSPVMFLELAILMNITKWLYFFMVVQTHRNIREEEIKVEVYADYEDQ